MPQLSIFDQSNLNFESEDPFIQSLQDSVKLLGVYAQDNATGFPVYGSDTKALKVYKNTFPQRVEAAEPISAGWGLNIFYDEEVLKCRGATASDPLRFCNSVALTSGDAGELIYCTVKVGVFPVLGPSGALYLDSAIGQFTPSPPDGVKIVQKVGESTGRFFYFHFHTPALVSPFDYIYLEKD